MSLPYNLSTLNFLSDKTSLFLLEYFRNICYNQGNSIPIYSNKTIGRKKEKRLKAYKLATWEKK